MDWTLEFHGSEVQWANAIDGVVTLQFSAAAIRQRGGVLGEEGHVKGLELRFNQATMISGDPASCIGALSDSTVHLQGMAHRSIALPFEATGPVIAEFNFRSGESLTLSAQAVQCLPPADAHFQPSYAC